MKYNVTRSTINFLAFLALFCLFIYRGEPIAPIIAGVCLVLSLFSLFVSISGIHGDSLDKSKIKTLRGITVFNILLVLAVAVFIVLVQTKTISVSEDLESVLAALVLSSVVLILGNLCPRLPFTRHTGLRLPWTVADEDTWIVAHRLLGYCSLPIGIIGLATCFVKLSPEIRAAICIAIFLIWICIAAIGSYLSYRRKYKN